MDLREELLKFKDEKYKEFNSKLTRTKYPIIGVRIPIIKQLAKKSIIDFAYFDTLDNPYFEEVMLEGLMIGNLKKIDDVIKRLEQFVCKIDDWSVCDSVCANLKITNKNKGAIWDFINKYKNSNNEFEVRFMLIMMLDYYLDGNYIKEIFSIIDNIKCEEYYVKMAIAWLLATSIVKCEKETLKYVEKCKLDIFTFNKMISKSCESYRVREDLKILLKSMKR